MELSQSRTEQHDYLKNVELARVLDKRAERKKEKGEVLEIKERPKRKRQPEDDDERKAKKPAENPRVREAQMTTVLSSIF